MLIGVDRDKVKADWTRLFIGGAVELAIDFSPQSVLKSFSFLVCIWQRHYRDKAGLERVHNNHANVSLCLRCKQEEKKNQWIVEKHNIHTTSCVSYLKQTFIMSLWASFHPCEPLETHTLPITTNITSYSTAHTRISKAFLWYEYLHFQHILKRVLCSMAFCAGKNIWIISWSALVVTGR